MLIIANTIFPDESLSGFVFRILYCYGALINENDLLGVVNSAGSKWIFFPNIKTDYQYMFQPYPPLDMYDSFNRRLKQSSLIYKTNPKSVLSIFSKIFYNRYVDHDFYRKNKKIPDIEIKFCVDCFYEQIKENGISWFKSDWEEPHSRCRIHHKNLIKTSHLISCCKRDRLQKIQAALTGVCPCCLTTCWPNINNETYFDLGLPRDNETLDSFISPCAIEIFVHWIVIFNKGNAFNLDFNAAHWINIIRYSSNGNLKPNIESLEHILASFKYYIPVAYDYFINHFLDELKISCEDCFPHEIKIPFLVSKNRNCFECIHHKKTCPLSHSIKLFSLSDNSDDIVLGRRNFCDARFVKPFSQGNIFFYIDR
ncbi:hypothetical protein [Yersinia pseudotuberculosis]